MFKIWEFNEKNNGEIRKRNGQERIMKKEDFPIFNALDDNKVLGLTIYGEARGESVDGKVAVGGTILTRKKHNSWYGNTIKKVCFKQYQYSCYNEKDPNYMILKGIAQNFLDCCDKDKILKSCYNIANGLIEGTVIPEFEATHYHTDAVEPVWKDDLKYIGKIGHHIFYMEV